MLTTFILTFILAFLSLSVQASDDFFDTTEEDSEFASQEIPSFADPLEKLNRTIFFTQYQIIDPIILQPLATTYNFITPTFIQPKISNLLDNLNKPIHATNLILAGRPSDAVSSINSFFTNIVFGFLGTQNIANELQIRSQRFDADDLLLRYNIYDNIYFVNPIGAPGTISGFLNTPENMLINVYQFINLNNVPGFLYPRVTLAITDLRNKSDSQITEAKANSADLYATFRSIFTLITFNRRRETKQFLLIPPIINLNQYTLEKSKSEYLI